MTNFFIQPLEANTRLRPDHNTDNNYLSLWGPLDTIECSEVFTAQEDLFKNGTRYQMVGDQWARVVKINNQPTFDSWMALVHMGAKVCQIVPAPPPPAPESPFVKAVLFRADGSTVEFIPK